MYKNLFLVISLITVLLTSCSKETSIEAGGGANGCRVKSMVLLDSVSGTPVYALNTLFSVIGKAQSIEAVDSITKQVELTQPFVYNKDSILLGDGQFIVLDSVNRVKRFQFLENPTDPNSNVFIYQYIYDANGYLMEKALSRPQSPPGTPLLKYTYTWSGGNLTRIEGRVNMGTSSVRIFLAEMAFDPALEPLNFMYIYPEATESFLFLNALNYAKKNTNLLKTMTIIYYDQQGAQTDKYVSTIVNPKLDNDRLVTEWTVNGDSFDPFGIFVGKTRFDYFCR